MARAPKNSNGNLPNQEVKIIKGSAKCQKAPNEWCRRKRHTRKEHPR